MNAPRLRTRADGYERFRVWDSEEKRERYVYVHQLIRIAEGDDPHCVFSNGAFHVHHRDGVRWHNTAENTELLRSDDHARETFGGVSA
jgi:hypothetical protein